MILREADNLFILRIACEISARGFAQQASAQNWRGNRFTATGTLRL